MTLDTFREKIANYWNLQIFGASVYPAVLSAVVFPTLFVSKRPERTETVPGAADYCWGNSYDEYSLQSGALGAAHRC